MAREHLRANLSIDEEDFEAIPILANAGGIAVAKHAFGADRLVHLIGELNGAIAA